MDSPINEIKERLDVVDVISGYIKTEKTGANYRALCPFHSEKKPSLFISPTRQIWKCFGCGASGDMFGFVEQIEGVEFGDALRILAKRAGVELRKQNPKIETARKRFYEICEWAVKFFEKQLYNGQIGKKAKDYLLKRGITEKSIKEWRIGFAPETWDSLLNFLKTKGFSVGEIERAGLILTNDKGKIYDRFRGRIIFPIFDLNSQTIGFGGRAFTQYREKGKEVTAKYLNIPNTLLYNKSKVLYGLNRAKVPIRKEDACVLVEGYTDVIMSHQAGVENVVATSGTALTNDQLVILKRYSENLITAFDMDIAGDSATKRGIDLAQAQGFDIKVVHLSEGKDPADVAFSKAEDWKTAVKEAKSIIDFYFENAFSMFDSQKAEGKRKISQTLLPVIKRIQNKIEQSSWIKELAMKLEVSEESVEQELQKYSSVKKVQSESKEPITSQPIVSESPRTRRKVIEEKIISLILNYPEGLKLIKSDYLNLFSSGTREVIKIFQDNPNSLSKDFKDLGLSEEQQEFLNFLALKGGVEIEESDEDINIKDEILICFQELGQFAIKEKLRELSRKIKQAQRDGLKEKTESLSEEFNKLIEKLAKINN
ncbi:MAG: DNA primase [Patescibacteria group bacterium]|nr:DNA primase [Patescibacteria group bacterium]